MTIDTVPRLTTESLISLAVGYQLAPPPLLLIQLGFDASEEDASEEFIRYVERGSRTLRLLNDSLDPSEEVKEELWRHITVMSQAPAFATLRRSDKPGSQVLYHGEESIVDEIDEYGNHRLAPTDDVTGDLRQFFGDYPIRDGLTITCPTSRFQPGVLAPADEDPHIARIASSDTIGYLVFISCPAKARARPLRWCRSDGTMFHIENAGDQVTFSAVSSQSCVNAVDTVLAEVMGE